MPRSGVMGTRRSGTLASRWIKAGELLSSADADADVSHAALALGHLVAPPSLVESLLTVRKSPVTKYDGCKRVVWRHKYLTDGQREVIAKEVLSHLGGWYGGLKLPLFALDAITGWDFSGRFGLTRFPVCSGLVARAYEVVLGDKPFGRPWQATNPDQIDDWCLGHPEWVCSLSTLKTRGQ